MSDNDNGFETFQSTTRQRVCQRMADRLAHKMTMTKRVIQLIHRSLPLQDELLTYMEAELAKQQETHDALQAEIVAAIPKPNLRLVQ